MTTTTEPITAPVEVADQSRCEAVWVCATHGEDRCPNRASQRLTVRCDEPGCDHGALVVLVCEPCAREFERTYGPDRIVRRPL